MADDNASSSLVEGYAEVFEVLSVHEIHVKEEKLSLSKIVHDDLIIPRFPLDQRLENAGRSKTRTSSFFPFRSANSLVFARIYLVAANA